MKQLPSQTLLCTMFRYNASKGTLIRKLNGRKCIKKVSIGNLDYWVSRVVWKMRTGRDPQDVISFKDGDRANIKWNNLIELTHVEQRVLGGAHSGSETGVRGVHKISEKKFRVQIRWKGRKIHLGTFRTVGAGAAARRAALQRLMRG